MLYNEFREAGYRIFGLHGATNGICDCDNPKCEAPFKHPIASNWQHTPDWSDEQLEVMEMTDQLKTGYGVLCKNLLVIDVDERNGGADSYKRLIEAIPEIANAGLIVRTGSGGNSKHLYFSLNGAPALLQHHEDYKGIDFKSSGYVVGPGSQHVSGNTYEVLIGDPYDITPAPQALLDLLKKPERTRTEYNGTTIDIGEQDIETMLTYISPDCTYETWVKVGFAVHDGTDGAGFYLWDNWSAGGGDYPGSDQLEKKWHSFGKTSTPITIATLISMAQENGYQTAYDEVTFTSDISFDEVTLDTTGIDLTRPPGFVGELTQWINDQCLYPREHLAVAAALSAIGNICGLRHIDDQDGMTLNLMSFCVAGSSTGKEAVQQAYLAIMKAGGMAPTIHGDMKSQQEVVRNLQRHQSCNYMIDELGIQLKRVVNSQQRGGASYLEGLIGMLMSAYSKADGFMPVSGDVREGVEKILLQELTKCKKAIDENEDKNGYQRRRLAQIQHALLNLDQGIERPFLSILGFTTPVTFNSIASFEQATNGFLSRSLIFNELETNPKRKQGFKKRKMPDSIASSLSNMAAPGEFSMVKGERIEFYGKRNGITTTKEAAELMDKVYQAFWDKSEQHKSQSGLEAIPRRGYELCAKISAILAAPSGVRETEHVRFAYALTDRDIESKLRLAYSNIQEEDKNNLDAVSAKILNCLTKDHGETLAVLCNRCRPHKKEVVVSAIERLEKSNLVTPREGNRIYKGKPVEKYFLT
jgi:hypothetical protein